MKKQLYGSFLVSFAVLFFLSCGNKETNAEKALESGSEAELSISEDGGRLTIALTQVPKNLDPIKYTGTYESNVMRSIYNTLVIWTDDQQRIVPSLAESWEISEDMLEYTFTIRKGVRFHDGSELTVDDVVFSLDRSANLSALGRLPGIEDVVKIDDRRMKLVLNAPNAALMARLTDMGNAVVPQAAVESMGDSFNTAPIGSGPFQIEEFAQDDNVTLSKYKDYWLTEPKLDEVIFRFIPDSSMQVNALFSGDVDMVMDVPGADIRKVKDHKDFDLQQMPAMNVFFAAMDLDEGPTRDLRVRQAISYALDIDATVENIFKFGGGEKAVLPLPKLSWGYDESLESQAIDEYNPDKARALLAEAGYADGFDLTIVTPNRPYREKWAQIMQAQLAEVGITAQIEKMEWGTYSAKVSAGDAQIYLLAWTWYPDPDFFLTQFFHSGRVGTLGNGQGYVNEEVTALLDAATSETTDQNTRAEMYSRVIELVLQDTPRIEGWHKQLNYGLSRKVKGFTVSPDDSIQIVTPERNVSVSL